MDHHAPEKRERRKRRGKCSWKKGKKGWAMGRVSVVVVDDDDDGAPLDIERVTPFGKKPRYTHTS